VIRADENGAAAPAERLHAAATETKKPAITAAHRARRWAAIESSRPVLIADPFDRRARSVP
jgi:hypothetical protein